MRTCTMKWARMLLVVAMLLGFGASAVYAANTLNGTIYGGSNPLANAAVTLANTAIQTQIYTTESSAAGAYAFSVSNGTYNLTVTPPAGIGFDQSVVNGIIINNANVTQNVILIQKAVTVSGVVRGFGGALVPSIEVHIYDQASNTELGSTLTNASGQFTLSVPPGTYKLMVRNYANSSNKQLIPYFFYYYPVSNLVVIGSTAVPDISVPAVKVSGKTTDSNGVAVGEVTVSHAAKSGLANSGYVYGDSVLSNAQGEYSILVLSGSGYNFTIDPSAGSGFARTMVNAVDATTDLTKNLVLSGAVTVSGVVRGFGGALVPSIEVHIYDQASNTELGSILTNASGQFTLSVPPGTYKLMVRNYANSSNKQLIPYFFYYYPVSNLVVIGSTAVPDISVPAVKVSGKTTDSNGVAVGGVTVSNAAKSGLANSGYVYVDSVLSNAQGEYSILVLSGSGYNFTIDPSAGSGFARTMVNAVDATTDLTKNLVLSGAVTVSGVVRGFGGALVPSIEVHIYDQASNTELGSTLTNASGQFTLSVPPGTYKLMVRNYANSSNKQLIPYFFYYYPVSNLVVIGSTAVPDISVPAVKVSGKTTDSNGVAVGGVTVSNAAKSGLANSGYVYGDSVLSNAQGEYSILVLSGSGYNFTIDPPAGSGFARTMVNNISVTSNIFQGIILNLPDYRPPVITSGPLATSIDATSAVIEWIASEPVTAVLSYGTTAPTSSTSIITAKSAHSYTLSGLSPDTLYYIQAAVTDIAGNGPVSSTINSFRTPINSFTQSPVILEGPTVEATNNSATVTWSTDIPSTGNVYYGTTTPPATTKADTNSSTRHSISLSSLKANTKYYLKVDAKNPRSTTVTTSSIIDFKTPADPSPLPVIVEGPLDQDVSDTGAYIFWKTDKPASSGVSYNDGTAYGVASDDTMTIVHNVRLSSLTPSTQYSYTVASKDEMGNGPVISAPLTFNTIEPKTPQPPKIIENSMVVNTTDVTADVFWGTDKLANSVVEYGLADTLGSSISNATVVIEHNMSILNLTPGTTYYFRVSSTGADGTGPTTSETITFITASTGSTTVLAFTKWPQIEYVSYDRVIVSWETSLKADSVADYWKITSDVMRVSDSTREKTHQITLSNLAASTTYTTSVTSTDLNKKTIKALISFTTSAPPRPPVHILDGPDVIGLTDSKASIKWRTDITADSRVKYGLQPTSLTESEVESRYSKEHVVVLTNLQPGATYYFSVTSVSPDQNSVTSSVYTFTTRGTPISTGPGITVPTITVQSDIQALVNWATNEPATSQIAYGIAADRLEIATALPGLTESHQMTLTGLNPATTYYLKVISANPSGIAAESEVFSFSTYAVPVYWKVTPTPLSSGSISPSAEQQIKDGDVIKFIVTAPANQSISSVAGCSGVLVDNVYSAGPIHGDCAIGANFVGPISVSLVPNTASPQVVGTSIAFTVAGSGGTGSYLYQFLLSSDGGVTYDTMQSYGAGNNWTLDTTGMAPATSYRVGVWIKNNTSAATYDAATSIPYTISPLPTPTVTLAASVASPQVVGTSVAFTATGSDGTGSYLYQFLLSTDGGTTYATTQGYSTSNSWTLDTTGMTTATNYRVGVWIKNSSSAATNEGTASIPYTIAPLPIPTVTVAASAASPQIVGTSVAFTATGSGGTGSYLYQFLLSADGGTTYAPTQGYSTSNSWTLDTTGMTPATNYKVGVWIKNSTSAASSDAATSISYTIAAPPKPTVTLAASLASPQVVGSSITFTATGSGGTGSYLYQFLLSKDGGLTYTATQAYGASNSWTLDTTGVTPATNYKVGVWIKNSTSAASSDAATSISYTIAAPPKPAVTLAASLASPQVVGTSITFTATGSGGTGNYLYQFLLSKDGGLTYTATQAYGASSTWTLDTAGMTTATYYKVGAWIKNSTSSANSDAATSIPYTIVAPPKPAVTLAASLASPQVVGTSITFTATGSGGTGNYLYQFLLSKDGGLTYTATQAYGASNSWTLDTTGMTPATNHKVGVWIKNSTSAASSDAATSISYTIAAPPKPAVTLAASLVSPQVVGTSITFTASGSGGTSSYLYQFLISKDGGVTYATTQAYGASNSWTLNTTGMTPAANYKIGVWIKNSTSSATSEGGGSILYEFTSPPKPTVALTTSVTSPQAVGTSVTITATSSGGIGSYLYQFLLSKDSGVTYSTTQAYGVGNTWTLDTTGMVPSTNYRIGVWIRNSTSSATNEGGGSIPYTIK